MKVKVSYTVDFDDIPEIITELLQECKSAMQSEINKLKFVPHDPEKMLHNLGTIRSSLAQLDASVQDIEHLVSGWSAVVSGELESPEFVPGEDSEEN